MENSQEKTGRVLEEARAAFRAQEYPLAMELYERFFDHVLDDPESGFAAVRLSYCLDEWAKLGAVYEPARIKLEQRRAQSIQELESTRKPDKFHEFIAICEFTRVPHLVVEQFLEYHQTDKELAKIIFGLARDRLAAGEQWEVCGSYMDDPERDYAIALQVFDASARLSQANRSLGDEFEDVYKNRYVREVSNLVTILSHVQRFAEAQGLCELANKDMQERGLKEFLSVYPEDFED